MNEYTLIYIFGIFLGFFWGCYISILVYSRKLDKLYYEILDGSEKGEQNELSSDRNEPRDQAVD